MPVTILWKWILVGTGMLWVVVVCIKRWKKAGNEMKRKELVDFAKDMALMNHRATLLGLTKTAELLRPIMDVVGWEVADKCGCLDSVYTDEQLTKKS